MSYVLEIILYGNKSKAMEYEKLKLELFNKYKPNRDLYTDGKRKFINKVVNLGKNDIKEDIN